MPIFWVWSPEPLALQGPSYHSSRIPVRFTSSWRCQTLANLAPYLSSQWDSPRLVQTCAPQSWWSLVTLRRYWCFWGVTGLDNRIRMRWTAASKSFFFIFGYVENQRACLRTMHCWHPKPGTDLTLGMGSAGDCRGAEFPTRPHWVLPQPLPSKFQSCQNALPCQQLRNMLSSSCVASW